MSTTDTPAVLGSTGGAPSVVLDALLCWAHRDGATTQALVRVRGHDRDGTLGITVVASQLRDNPPGFDILGDFAGLANAVSAQLIGPAIAREDIAWYAHHGAFSSYDPTGPDTLTRVRLSWAEGAYLPAALDQETLLSAAQARELTTVLGLAPVADVLAAGHWPLPAPRRGEPRAARG